MLFFIILLVLTGLIVGALGRLAIPGPDPMGIGMTILVGIVAALIGSAIAGSFRDTSGIDWIEIIIQLALAVVGVGVVSSLRGGRRTS